MKSESYKTDKKTLEQVADSEVKIIGAFDLVKRKLDNYDASIAKLLDAIAVTWPTVSNIE